MIVFHEGVCEMSNAKVELEAGEIYGAMAPEFKFNPLIEMIIAIALPLVMNWVKSICPNMPAEDDPKVFRQRATRAYDKRRKTYRRSVLLGVAQQVRIAGRREEHQVSKDEALEAARRILDRARTADDEAFQQVGLVAAELSNEVGSTVEEDEHLDDDLFQ